LPWEKIEWGVPEKIVGRIVLKLYHHEALIYTASKKETQRAFLIKSVSDRVESSG
jgi:uracil-DNA glycosylase